MLNVAPQSPESIHCITTMQGFNLDPPLNYDQNLQFYRTAVILAL